MKQFRVLIIGLAMAGFIGSCQSSQHFSKESHPQNTVSADSVRYSLVYIIHGDAGYLYHDENGEGKQADEQAVKEAKEIAREAKKGEVFIFHQRPEKKILWLFPKKDRLLYHYKNGELVHQQKYSPSSSKESLTAEASLYRQHVSENSSRKFLLYFGHEVPAQDIGYHHSRKQSVFTIDTFSMGIGRFLRNKERFELTILSTCDNGTPEMASKISSYTNSLLASPKNLHLSHMDTDSLLKLEEDPEMSELRLAQAVAEDTFDRLNKFIQTAITLSIYDLQRYKEEIHTLGKAYSQYKNSSTAEIDAENIACEVLPFWKNVEVPAVNQVLYKPPRFGEKNPQDHFSGWGCKK